jgi:hypothetical protein
VVGGVRWARQLGSGMMDLAGTDIRLGHEAVETA